MGPTGQFTVFNLPVVEEHDGEEQTAINAIFGCWKICEPLAFVAFPLSRRSCNGKNVAFDRSDGHTRR